MDTNTLIIVGLLLILFCNVCFFVYLIASRDKFEKNLLSFILENQEKKFIDLENKQKEAFQSFSKNSQDIELQKNEQLNILFEGLSDQMSTFLQECKEQNKVQFEGFLQDLKK